MSYHSDPGGLPSYKYAGLQNNEIRIATLLPCGHGSLEDDSVIEIRLKIYQLSNLPHYRTLSYCWGVGPADRSCRCKSTTSSSAGHLWISGNLEQALIHIRSREEVLLWVDQLCINQQDEEEKRRQVQLMRQVYTKASEVIVWLGHAEAETALAFNLIEDIVRQLQAQGKDVAYGQPLDLWSQSHSLDLRPADSSEWIAFRNLLSRPFFSRLWVFQEIILSPKAHFMCGAYRTSFWRWYMACSATRASDQGLPENRSHLKRADTTLFHMAYCFASYWDPWKPSLAHFHPPQQVSWALGNFELLNLMDNLLGKKASFPQDHVWALLGLAERDSPIRLPISFGRPFQHLFFYISKYFVREYSDLSILSLVCSKLGESESSGEPSILSSWAPDYRYEVWKNYRRFSRNLSVIEHGSHRYYNATGNSRALTRLNTSETLRVKGVNVGSIQVLSGSADNAEDTVTIGPNVLDGGRWSQIADHCADNMTYPPTKESIRLAYSRLRVADYLPGEYNIQQRLARQKLPLQHPELLSTLGQTESGKDPGSSVDHEVALTLRIVQTTSRQRLFFIDSGYMGLCQNTCGMGDQVWLLMGNDMPCVLRKVDTKPVTYRFLGESYVHGIMDGEYLLQHMRKKEFNYDDEGLLNRLKDEIPFETKDLLLL